MQDKIQSKRIQQPQTTSLCNSSDKDNTAPNHLSKSLPDLSLYMSQSSQRSISLTVDPQAAGPPAVVYTVHAAWAADVVVAVVASPLAYPLLRHTQTAEIAPLPFAAAPCLPLLLLLHRQLPHNVVAPAAVAVLVVNAAVPHLEDGKFDRHAAADNCNRSPLLADMASAAAVAALYNQPFGVLPQRSLPPSAAAAAAALAVHVSDFAPAGREDVVFHSPPHLRSWSFTLHLRLLCR